MSEKRTLKVGDKIIKMYGGEPTALYTIKHETPKRVKIDNKYFHKETSDNGFLNKVDRGYPTYSYRVATDELVARLKERIEINKLKNLLEGGGFEKIPTGMRKKLIEILEK